MLLAEELALVALKPQSGRHQIGTGDALNACLAGLLVAELLLEGAVGPGDRDDRLVAVPGREAPASPALAAALQVVAEKGPKVRSVLSHMSRGLEKRLGMSTREVAFSGLAGAGIVGASTGRCGPNGRCSIVPPGTPSSTDCGPRRRPTGRWSPAPDWSSP